MMSKLGTLIHNEIVAWYVGLNIVLVNLSVLGVHWLTDTRIKAIIAIGDVLFGAVVRALVTPTSLTPPAVAAPVNVTYTASSGNWAYAPTPVTNVSTSEPPPSDTAPDAETPAG